MSISLCLMHNSRIKLVSNASFVDKNIISIQYLFADKSTFEASDAFFTDKGIMLFDMFFMNKNIRNI